MIRLRPAARLLPLLVLAGIVAGCGEPEAPRPGETAEIDRLRSLPYAGFSSQPAAPGDSGVVVFDRERSYPGYTLYTLQALARAELIDAEGRVVHAWRNPGGGRWERATLTPDGDLLVVGADPSDEPAQRIPDAARYLMRLDWNGEVLWERRMNAHHDVTVLPDGRLLALAFQRRRAPAVHRSVEVRDDLLMMLDADGRVLDSRSLLDAFLKAPEIHRLHVPPPDLQGVEPWVDPFHANSVRWIEAPAGDGDHPTTTPGNVLVCMRHQNAVAVIRWDDGDLLWVWGPGILRGPHDARLLDDGHLLVFDNGVGLDRSRVLEVEPESGEIVWEYGATPPQAFYTLSKGSSQRLPNGNTLIANSDNGEAFEVTREGEAVWRFRNPHLDDEGRRAAIVRAVRYEAELIDGLLERDGRTRAGDDGPRTGSNR
jgi:hypothetical protein